MSSSHPVILFGAGASYGSQQVLPGCPPLGAQLFDQLQRSYPNAWGKIPPKMRSDFVPYFELGMKKVWDSGSHDGVVLLRCMADFFAQFRADHGNAYARLLEHLEYAGILHGTHFSSLNYDCVLETAARDFGFARIDYGSEEPTRTGMFSVWKIHGSCNFLPTVVSGRADAISYGPNAVKWDGGDVRIVDPSQVRHFVAQSAFYPAMAVFMEGKPVHSSPSVVRKLQEWWKEAVAVAPVIGIIGVNPNPADVHIWKPLAETAGRIVVIGDTSSYEKWTNTNRGSERTEIVGERFADSLHEFRRAFAA